MSDTHASLVWGVSQLTDVPNVIVMGCLLALLLVLERRHRHMHIRLWIVALAIVFFDEMLWLVPHAEGTWRTPTHTARLIGELLAGVTFLIYEYRPMLRLSTRQRFVLLTAPALVVLQLLYGLNVRTAEPYVLCSALAILVQVALYGRERSLNWYMASLPAVWVAVALLALAGDFRTAAYSAVSYVFVAATRNFWLQLKSAYVGRVVVTVSLLLWAASLLVHPWVMGHREWTALAEQTWAMQKFIVTFGMVVVLFEEESRQHEYLSNHDNLTGLANRRQLEHVLRGHIQAGRASVLLMDLDGFKQVNDKYGHAAGDSVLQEVARRLLALGQPGDTIARIGGDEFIVTAAADLTSRIEEFCEAVSQPMKVHGGMAHVGGSTGFSLYPDDAPGQVGEEAVSTLLNTADLRMYTFKHRPSSSREEHSLISGAVA